MELTDCPPVIFIGLDGAEPSLLRRWMAAGELPELAALAAHGSLRDVASLPGLGDGAVWPTLITGVNPGRHGRYFRLQLAAGGYRHQAFEVDRDLDHEPFWSALSRSGQRIAVLDVPYAPGSGPINGLLLTDWLIHDRYGAPRGWPADFAREVVARYGDDPLAGNSDLVPDDAAGSRWLLDRSLQRVDSKATLVTRTLERERWDMLITTFTEPHDVGHRLWHLHDAGHPMHDPAWRSEHGDPLLTLYRRIDAAIGRIVAAAPADAAFAVFMGLGMGPNYSANKVLDTILRRLDGQPEPWRLRARARHAGLGGASIRLAGRVDEYCRVRTDARSRFFAVPHNANAGAIRINLRGRDPKGIVDPAELPALLDHLTTRLERLTNPHNREPIVSEVIRVADSCHGAHAAVLPDLLAVWNRTVPFDAVCSPDVGLVRDATPWGRSGDHTPNAALLIGGPGVAGVDLQRTLSVVDIAPTLADLCNVRMAGVDGKSALLRSRLKVIDR